MARYGHLVELPKGLPLVSKNLRNKIAEEAELIRLLHGQTVNDKAFTQLLFGRVHDTMQGNLEGLNPGTLMSVLQAIERERAARKQ